jgi:hypothetical protein
VLCSAETAAWNGAANEQLQQPGWSMLQQAFGGERAGKICRESMISLLTTHTSFTHTQLLLLLLLPSAAGGCTLTTSRSAV